MEKPRADMATFDQGRFDALQLAFVTFVEFMKPELRTAFCAQYAKNVEVFETFTLPVPIAEAWREGLSTCAASIQTRLASQNTEESSPPRAQ